MLLTFGGFEMQRGSGRMSGIAERWSCGMRLLLVKMDIPSCREAGSEHWTDTITMRSQQTNPKL